MHLKSCQVKNFRLLNNIKILLEEKTTLVVGRNNSGKTSLSEVIRRFTNESSPSFRIQDFSIASYEGFCEAQKLALNNEKEEMIRKALPFIELRLIFQYDPSQLKKFGALQSFVIDLDMNCEEAIAVMRFELNEGAINKFLNGFLKKKLKKDDRAAFFSVIEERIPELYSVKIWAEDPFDPKNRQERTRADIRALLTTEFINAQRGLSDETSRESDVLAKILEAVFNNASLDTENVEEQTLVLELEEAVKTIQSDINGDFKEKLEKLLPALNTLGYPGLNGPQLTTETTLNVQRLLNNNTKVRYKNHTDVLLPESHNGLGMRNLIFILLQIFRFYKEYRAQKEPSEIQLIFIEEPEAHLHPQMQEVFIRQLNAIVQQFNDKNPEEPSWPVQFVISTHSSHVANESDFETIRYFMPVPIKNKTDLWETKIKDLRKGMPNITPIDKKFLQQYLTLTRCDLFFADKAILIEGTSERLLLPVMISKNDKNNQNANQLLSQYITIIEVGGAYAHKFFELLNFLELKSLIITDLDPVLKSGGEKCLTSEAIATSNNCIKNWFGKKITPKALSTKQANDKTKGQLRIAYQTPEKVKGPCGRTLEDAFMLANQDIFEISGKKVGELEKNAKEKAEKHKKTEFALTYAIDKTEWATPLYIKEGLEWLAGSNSSKPVIKKKPKPKRVKP